MADILSVVTNQLPAAEQRIARLYCWVVVQEGGSEGIAAAGPVPLISSDRRQAHSLEAAARRVAEAERKAGRPVRVELRAYDLASPPLCKL